MKTVAAMKTFKNFNEGDIVRTQGFYSPEDGGSAYYQVDRIDSKAGESANEIDIFELKNQKLIARLTPFEKVNIQQFGANGADELDDYSTIQRAINYCQKNEIHQLFFPSGNYFVSSTLHIKNYGTTDVTKRPAGLDLIGNGAGATTLSSLPKLEGAILQINGQSISSSYVNGGELSGIRFNGNFIGNNNPGLEFLCWWYGSISNCKFEGFTGDAIRQISDFEANKNPDFTASVSLKFSNSIIQYCNGFGFHNTGLQGAPGYSFENCIFTACKKGGAYVQSSSYRFITCSFSACGWNDNREMARGTTDSYGIHFGGNSATANSRHIIEGCEFDNNKTAHIACSYLANSRFVNNRFIHEYRGEKLHPPAFHSIIIAPYSHDETVRNIEFTSNFFRLNSFSPSDVKTITLFDWKHTANVQNIYIKMNSISNNSNPRDYLAVTNFKGYDFKDMHIKNNYVIDNNGIGPENEMVSFGTPPPFYLGTISNNQLKLNGKNQILIFDQPDPLFDEKGNFQNQHYKTTTGQFICPYAGFYTVKVQLEFNGLEDSETAILEIVNNETTIAQQKVSGSKSLSSTIHIDTKIYGHKGDTIQLRWNAPHGVQLSSAQSTNQLSIQLTK